ncbi:MAG: hypothetical protein AAFO07_07300 [Bacteroidota bacterium]
MDFNHSAIQKRQDYFWLGRKYEEDNDLPAAIEAYKTYSTHLADTDQHIPNLWISKFYDQLEEPEQALFHLEAYAKGCSNIIAAKVYKDLAERYLLIDHVDQAILHFENALAKDDKVGVKKKLKKLKTSLV